MSETTWTFESFNAKRMSPLELANSFVTPPSFARLIGPDHCYILGPRGSGKTTLLRMLQGESLMARVGPEGEAARRAVSYSSIFLPADELWASQTSADSARAAFATQLLYAFVETMIYRTQATDRFGNAPHLGVSLSASEEVALAKTCAEAWGVEPTTCNFYGLLSALDLALISIPEVGGQHHRLATSDSLTLLSVGVRAFNAAVRQPGHRWALLLDEMELAPGEIHQQIAAFVRGGTASIIVKASMSPYDRYGSSFGVHGGPIPGHDFQTIYLADMRATDVSAFTEGLWRVALADRRLPDVPLSRALGRSAIEIPGGSSKTTPLEVARVIRRVNSSDPLFAAWLKERRIDPNRLADLSYNQRSATIRKVYPLLVFREALTTTRGGKVIRRSRKKSLEPFTGARAVTLALEGNPRWAKSAFSQMMSGYDPRSQTIDRGVQFDSLNSLAARFEGLLRVLPIRHAHPAALPVATIVDIVASYFNAQNTGPFSSDPKNCFTIDRDAGPEIIDSMVLGLYAGAFVHLRDRQSPALITDIRGQRFRLAYLLGVRDHREFPLRRGKDVRLSAILDTARESGRLREQPSEQLGLDFK